MDLPAPVAANLNAPNPLGMVGQFQDIQGKMIHNQRAALDLQTAQQTQNPTIRQAYSEASSSASNANVAALQAHEKNIRALQAQIVARAARDDVTPEDIRSDVQSSAKNMGIQPQDVDQALAGLPMKGTTADVRKYAMNAALRMQDHVNQIQSLYPQSQMLQTGGAQVPVGGGGPLAAQQPGTFQGPATANTLGPGQLQTVQTDPQGRLSAIERDPQGNVLRVRSVAGVGTGGTAPGQPAAPYQQPAPSESLGSEDQLRAELSAAQGAATRAPNLHSLNKEIYSLADSSVQTGALGGLLRRVASATGYNIPFGSDAENYNTLGKMLAQSNQQLAQSMGPHTNAGLEQQNQAGGTVEYDKNTIKTIAQRNDALASGAQLYAQGLQQAMAQGGPAAKRQFDVKWGQAFDVDAMALKNAIDNKNEGQAKMIVLKAGGKGSAGAHDLFQKLQAIDSLSGAQQ